MLRSMFSGVSGLRNHQVKMDVLSNNISNVNTQGFKAGRVTFQELYTQQIAPAAGAAASGQIGGLNPKQIGLGVSTQSIDVIHSTGAAQNTDRTLDMMVNGEGFFMVKDGEDMFYTRSGNFYLDSFGFLVTANGQYVQGAMMISELPEGLPEATSEKILSEEMGVHFDLTDKDSSGEWLVELTSEDNTTFPMYIAAEEDVETRDALFGKIVIPPNYQNIAISPTGVVTATDELGMTVNVAVLGTTTFINPAGLTRTSDNLYIQSANSGVPAVSIPGLGSSGLLKVGSLEMSNVDLSKEFTDMIITQRGFQANSRIITVSDTLLEELINLKR